MVGFDIYAQKPTTIYSSNVTLKYRIIHGINIFTLK